MLAYESALKIVQDTLGRMGLPVPASITQPSIDATAAQCRYLLTECGNKLLLDHGWQRTRRTWELTTVPAQKDYALPADWNGFVDATAWNLSTQLPLLGPVSPQQWNHLTARQIGPSTVTLLYRVENDRFTLYTAPSSAQDLRIDYLSTGWVRPEGLLNVPLKASIELDDDVPLMPPELLKSMLKLLFLEAKGFDATVAMRDFLTTLDAAKGRDRDAPTLSLVGGAGMRPLWPGVPDTGYGAAP